MNYLAHVFLARHSNDAMIGGMLGDFVKGSIHAYPAEVRAGILLHRAIDRYTDNHALVRASCALVSARRRRYAGIMVDVFFDHFLARHWQRFADTSLPAFTRHAYAQLLARSAEFPPRLQYILPRMAADDWLAAYRDFSAIDAAINGIARRFRRANPLPGGARELLDNYAALQANFLDFFPELLQFVQAAREAEALCAPRAVARNRDAQPDVRILGNL
jgi:acyl carrier protein phosphodiesterase